MRKIGGEPRRLASENEQVDAPDLMRRSRRSRAAGLGRLTRSLIPDRNPLRRRTDRLEAVLLAAVLAVLLAAAPLLAIAASGWEHSVSRHEMRVQQATWHHVRATLLEDAQDSGAYPAMMAEAVVRWTQPGGRIMTAATRVPENAKTGGVIWIWTNPSGQLVTPLRPSDIEIRDGLAAAGAITVLATGAGLAALAIRRTLNRRRLAAWGIDWRATEPRWNSRRSGQ